MDKRRRETIVKRYAFQVHSITIVDNDCTNIQYNQEC